MLNHGTSKQPGGYGSSKPYQQGVREQLPPATHCEDRFGYQTNADKPIHMQMSILYVLKKPLRISLS